MKQVLVIFMIMMMVMVGVVTGESKVTYTREDRFNQASFIFTSKDNVPTNLEVNTGNDGKKVLKLDVWEIPLTKDKQEIDIVEVTGQKYLVLTKSDVTIAGKTIHIDSVDKVYLDTSGKLVAPKKNGEIINSMDKFMDLPSGATVSVEGDDLTLSKLSGKFESDLFDAEVTATEKFTVKVKTKDGKKSVSLDKPLKSFTAKSDLRLALSEKASMDLNDKDKITPDPTYGLKLPLSRNVKFEGSTVTTSISTYIKDDQIAGSGYQIINSDSTGKGSALVVAKDGTVKASLNGKEWSFNLDSDKIDGIEKGTLQINGKTKTSENQYLSYSISGDAKTTATLDLFSTEPKLVVNGGKLSVEEDQFGAKLGMTLDGNGYWKNRHMQLSGDGTSKVTIHTIVRLDGISGTNRFIQSQKGKEIAIIDRYEPGSIVKLLDYLKTDKNPIALVGLDAQGNYFLAGSGANLGDLKVVQDGFKVVRDPTTELWTAESYGETPTSPTPIPVVMNSDKALFFWDGKNTKLAEGGTRDLKPADTAVTGSSRITPIERNNYRIDESGNRILKVKPKNEQEWQKVYREMLRNSDRTQTGALGFYRKENTFDAFFKKNQHKNSGEAIEFTPKTGQTLKNLVDGSSSTAPAPAPASSSPASSASSGSGARCPPCPISTASCPCPSQSNPRKAKADGSKAPQGFEYSGSSSPSDNIGKKETDFATARKNSVAVQFKKMELIKNIRSSNLPSSEKKRLWTALTKQKTLDGLLSIEVEIGKNE